MALLSHQLTHNFHHPFKFFIMNTSEKWIAHFMANAREQRINWNLPPAITKTEKQQVIHSLQAWQLGETSDGSQLLCAAVEYARSVGEPAYIDAIALFIKEEQKHGENLGRYLDATGEKRVSKNWGDTLFRKIRHLNTSMEMWTLAVITVESAAQVYYQALHDATKCTLLKEICHDILLDEAYHISFQTERMKMMYDAKSKAWKWLMNNLYLFFYFSTALVIWMAHKKVFAAGGNTLRSYFRKMKYKYLRTLRKLALDNRSMPRTAEKIMLFSAIQSASQKHRMN